MAELWLFFHREVVWFHWEPHGTKVDSRVFICAAKIQIDQEMADLWLFFLWEVAWFHWEPHWTEGDSRMFSCATKIQNQSRNGWVMTIFPLRGCVISLRFRWDQRRSSGVHLCHKDPKSVKKWLSYNYFHTERLRDFIENHMRPKGILGCSFVPQRSEIGQEMAELWLFSRWEVAWFHWEPHGTSVLSVR